MSEVLVAGATGALGSEIVKQLTKRNIPVRVLVRSEKSKPLVKKYTSDIFVADVTNSHNLDGIGKDVKTVISCLGKSVSLFTKRSNKFEEVDFEGNANLLRQCIKEGVKRFIYISIFGADKVPHMKVASVHMNFEQLLMKSGVEYTIVRPVGFYSGYNDLIILGKKGIIPVTGNGRKRTNSIHPADLASSVIQFLNEGPEIISIGGPTIHTRIEMAQMISKKTGGKIVHIPDSLFSIVILLNKLIRRNTHDKLSYFKYVTTNDMLAEPYGNISFSEYLSNIDLNDLQ